MDLKDIEQILQLVHEHDLEELELERDGLKVRIRKAGRQVVTHTAPPPAQPAAAGPGASAPAGDLGGEPSGAVELGVIKSPIVGTFYRAAEPGASPFVDVGDTVKKGQVLCIIEAMKLMNEIESDCDGEIVQIYVDNGKPVQFGDRLFAVKVV
jgi:acetyl-CoA carboxylase biotin carboxyl carrier protein